MPRIPRHALIWSPEQMLYELSTQGHLEQRFRQEDESAWLVWLGEATSFAFHGASGSLNVYREARPRGGHYWYAYHTITSMPEAPIGPTMAHTGSYTRKRYLGSPTRLTFARLEETARYLARTVVPLSPSPAAPVPLDPSGAASDSRLERVPEQMHLLLGRLAPPRLPHAVVQRERALSTLDGALSTPLTLVSAPAGWGKTTLLSAWTSRHKTPVAWLSLDELDSSPIRFWISLIAALRRCGAYDPGLGETALALLQSPQPPPVARCLSVLLHDLETYEAGLAPVVVLVVDDYHLISDAAVREGIIFFLEHLPAHLHLVLSSRVDPDLPLARWRVRGQLTEIRVDDLRFDQEEASRFLGRMLSSPPSADEVHMLTLRTEGWAAGLQLAGLALEKRAGRAAFVQTFAGSHRYLLDYVQEEILGRLPARVRDFLLHIAILSRVEASVCQAVTASATEDSTGRATCQQMLAYLERANLFLVPLDEEGRWYRLHELFREALLAVLHSTQPDLIPVLHRRAAGFYEAQGQWSEAITHAFHAADYSAAARLMEQSVEHFWVRGEAPTMARWALALPQPLVHRHARLVLTIALYLLNTVAQTTREQRARVFKEVRQLMARVETAVQSQANDTPDPEQREARSSDQSVLDRRLHLLRAGMAWYEAMATEQVERLNALHEEIQELDQDEEVIWQILPIFSEFLLYYAIRREGAVLVPRLQETKERVSRSESPFATVKVMQWLATAALEAGQLRLAYRESEAALDLIEQTGGYALLRGYFELVLAWVSGHWNRLEEARKTLQRVIKDAATWQHSDLLLSGYITLMQVELARGDLPAVQQALHEFEQLKEYEGYAHHWRWLPIIRAQLWLAQGEVETAFQWATGMVLPEGAWESSLYGAFPVIVRVYFAQRRWMEALALLEQWSGHLDRPANVQITIGFLAQLLVALHHTGKTERASEVATRLLALTEPEGYVGVYLDEGEPMRRALQAWLSSHSQPQYDQHNRKVSPTRASTAADPSTRAYVLRLLAAFEHEAQMTDGASASVEAALTPGGAPSLGQRSSPAASPGLAVSLTGREQEVLRLLASGASNKEIARSLVISLPTAKKHVSNLLGKLGASNRSQAVAQARSHSLL